MKIEYWCYNGVLENGRFDQDSVGIEGSVHVKPRVATSGNHHLETPSNKRDKYWVSVSTGLMEDKTVHGITIYFDDEKQMSEFERTGKIKI